MVRTAARVLLTVLASSQAVAQPAASVPPKRVLALYSDQHLQYATAQVETGLRSLFGQSRQPVEYFAEFMEAVRFRAPDEREALLTYLRDRYRTRLPDAILAAGRPALEFLVEHRRTLFPGVPLVHVALAPDEVPVDLDEQVVGLTSARDLRRALELALRLQPETRHVVVVSGASARDHRLLETTRSTASAMADRVTFQWLNQHTLEQVKAAVASLPPDSVVLFSSFFEDAAGRFFTPRDALEEISRVAAAPIYGPFESFIGYGIVGGTMETWQATGEESGRLILRILAGDEPRTAVARAHLPASTIVDWRQLQRWDISPANLPPGTELRFRPPTLWEAYRTQVLVFAAIAIAQLLLIGALAVTLQRRRVAEARRRDAEIRAAQLRDELAHASRVTLLGELAATLAHEINQPLSAILSNAQATRRWLKSDQPDLAEIRAIVEDIITDDKRAGEIIHRMRTLLKKGTATRTRFDLARSIKDVAALLRGELVTANVTLTIEAPESGLLVEGDEVATQQVLLNLMLNGIQAIQDSGSTIRMLRVQAEGFSEVARVVVHDTGRGISEEVRDRLFEPFFTTKSRGLGIGLSICRRIAEAHGGTLDLGPSSTGGATFVLAMPSAAGA